MQGPVNILACALTALLAGISPGVKYMHTVVQDDGVFLHSGPVTLARSANQLKSLGADQLRLTAVWSIIAPKPHKRVKPAAPFDATDSSTYPVDGFRRLDQAVVAATRAGLAVQMDLGFWAPRWAVAKGASNHDHQRWWPSPDEFAQFATAVARRYSGSFPDPNRPGQALPAVRTYTPWNEPNQASFLMPQWRRAGSGWRVASADVYRPLYLAGYDAVKAVSGANRVLIGNLASTGSTEAGQGSVPPLRFLRELACVNALLLPRLTRECAGYRSIPADGLALHPYSFRFGAPDEHSPNPDDAPLADTLRVTTLLTLLRTLGRIHGDWTLQDTEYGYQTNPPDPSQSTTPDQQAQYLSEASFMSWKDPALSNFAQFELRDVDPTTGHLKPRSAAYWKDYQTGLQYADGTPKPAERAFEMPFWAQGEYRLGQRVMVLFGMIRTPSQGRQVVRFERQEPGSTAWTPIGTYGLTCQQRGPDVLTDSSGTIFTTAGWQGPGSYRMLWRRSDGSWLDSVPIPVTEPSPSLLGGLLQPPTK